MSLVSMGFFDWVTPGDTRDAQDQVDTAVKILDRDIAATRGIDTFRAAWSAWRAGWDRFYADQGSALGWLGRFATGNPYEKTIEYRRQLEEWRAKFERLGGAPSAPGLPTVPKNSPAVDVSRNIMIAAAIVGGLWVASTVYRETRGRV